MRTGGIQKTEIKMEQNTVGKMIRYYRNRLGLSQEIICKGICSVATLSRIEWEERYVDLMTTQTLLERLGIEINCFEMVLDEKDFKLFKLREQIEKDFNGKKYLLVQQNLNRYRKLINEKQVLHQQFCSYMDVKLEFVQGHIDIDLIEKIKAALKYTQKDIDDIGNTELFSLIEFELMFFLKKCEKKEDYEFELQKLIHYSLTHYSYCQMRDVAAPLYMELIMFHQEHNNYIKMINDAEEALLLLQKGSSLKYIADFRFLKAKATYLYVQDLFENEIFNKTIKQKIFDECYMAYCIFEYERNEKKTKEVENFLMECLNVEI